MTEATPDPQSVPQAGPVGLLFVHGIGEQRRGDTLLRFAEPLVDWIRGATASDPKAPDVGGKEGAVRLGAVDLAKEGETTPAHFDMRTTGRSGNRTDWIVAESCWAKEFRNPDFVSVAKWLFSVGTWMILSHCGKSLRVRRKRWEQTLDNLSAASNKSGPGSVAPGLASVFQKLGEELSPRVVATVGICFVALPMVLAAVVLALSIQVLVLLLAVVAVIPIPKLRAGLSSLLLLITGTLGDSYLFVSSPLQRVAAVTRVHNDLAWIRERCTGVVVVAHSQGAAVAQEALARDATTKVKAFITFGSGLGKLEELRLLDGKEGKDLRRQAQWGLPLLPLLLLVPAVWGFFSESPWFLFGVPFAMVFLCIPILLLVTVFRRTMGGWERYLSHVRSLRIPNLPDCRWVDLYASHDPVPNGPLGGSDRELPHVESLRVTNRRSLVRDHSTYWKNRDEFVPMVVRAIDEALKTRLTDLDESIVRIAGRRRRMRMLLLTAGRYLMLPALMLVAAKDWSNLMAALRDLVASVPLESAGRFVGDVSTYLGFASPDTRELVTYVAGGALFLLAWFAWGAVLSATAAVANGRARKALFKRFKAEPWDFLDDISICVMPAAACLVFCLAVVFTPGTLGAARLVAVGLRWILTFYGVGGIVSVCVLLVIKIRRRSKK